MRSTANQANPGWTDTSPKGGNYDWINDEALYGTLNTHDSLWRRVLERYPKPQDHTVCIIGYGSLPMGIELSQRGYSIIYLAGSQQEADRVKLDCEAQAGFFKTIVVADWRQDVPNATICLFTGLMGGVHTERYIFAWMDMLLRRVDLVLCAEMTEKRNWKRLLDKRYHVNGLKYSQNRYTLLEIERR